MMKLVVDVSKNFTGEYKMSKNSKSQNKTSFAVIEMKITLMINWIFY